MAFPSAGIIDALTGVSISGNWSTDPGNAGRDTPANPTGSGGWQTQPAGGYAFEYWYNASTYGPDSEVYVDLTAGAGQLSRLWARMQQPSTSSSTVDGYMWQPTVGASGSLYRIINGAVDATIGTFTTTAGATGVGMEVTGTGATVTIKLYSKQSGVWTLEQTYTDTSANRITSAGYVGFLGIDTAGAARWKNFGGGTVVTTTPAQISGSSSAAATGSLSLGTGTPPTFSLSSTATATGSLGLTASGQLPLGQSTATATGTLDLTTTSAVGSRAAPGWLGLFITDTSGASVPLIAGGSTASATGSLSLLTPSARLISGSSTATASGTLTLTAGGTGSLTTVTHDTYTVAGTGGPTVTSTGNQVTVAEISDTSPLPA